MWDHLPAEALTAMNAERCNHGGYCTRTTHHRGMHTATPSPGTIAWDQRLEQQIHTAVTLLLLDVPTPYWADINDPLYPEEQATQ